MNLNDTLQGLIAQTTLNIDDVKRSKLVDYVHLIHKWNKVHNLTAIRDELSMLSVHIMDSLVVLPYLAPQQSILDVGSGAGLPGVVIAICEPSRQVTVIDANQKKASFMRQVKSELQLDNLTVLCGRVEQIGANQTFGIVISRAFSDLLSFISLTRHLCSAAGQWIAMKGQLPAQEMQDLEKAQAIKSSRIERLHVPGLDAERHLVFFTNN